MIKINEEYINPRYIERISKINVTNVVSTMHGYKATVSYYITMHSGFIISREVNIKNTESENVKILIEDWKGNLEDEINMIIDNVASVNGLKFNWET